MGWPKAFVGFWDDGKIYAFMESEMKPINSWSDLQTIGNLDVYLCISIDFPEKHTNDPDTIMLARRIGGKIV